MSDFPVIELDSTDSTNNYAMQLIDANKAQPGMTIVAGKQLIGKGQRGRTWVDEPGQSLLMSIIAEPRRPLKEQFVFSAAVAVAVANVLQKLSPGPEIRIKWPNDIIINDKKAGGILIENILRGSQWTHGIIGIGLNVNQEHFHHSLPNATSLKISLGVQPDMRVLRDEIIDAVLSGVMSPLPAIEVMRSYNSLLYKRDQKQRLSRDTFDWTVTVLAVLEDGRMEVKLQDATREYYQHGDVKWEWGG